MAAVVNVCYFHLDMLTNRWFLSAFATLALSCATHAASINTVFNTGVDATGTPLADGTVGDPHYLLTSVPDGTTDLRVRTSIGGFPVPPWLGDDSISAWIGPNNDSIVDGSVGAFDYRTTFNLTGFDSTTASLAGQWSVDNEGLNILINGVSTGITAAGPTGGDPTASFEQWTPFSISSGFVAGVNTVDFIVNNDGGPTGLRVEMTGSATETPEPASLMLLGAGLVVISKLRRRVRV
jgi:hypothetical protein